MSVSKSFNSSWWILSLAHPAPYNKISQQNDGLSDVYRVVLNCCYTGWINDCLRGNNGQMLNHSNIFSFPLDGIFIFKASFFRKLVIKIYRIGDWKQENIQEVLVSLISDGTCNNWLWFFTFGKMNEYSHNPHNWY